MRVCSTMTDTNMKIKTFVDAARECAYANMLWSSYNGYVYSKLRRLRPSLARAYSQLPFFLLFLFFHTHTQIYIMCIDLWPFYGTISTCLYTFLLWFALSYSRSLDRSHSHSCNERQKNSNENERILIEFHRYIQYNNVSMNVECGV